MTKELKEIVTRNLAVSAVSKSINNDLDILTENWDSADDYFMENFGCTLRDAEEALGCKFDIERIWNE